MSTKCSPVIVCCPGHQSKMHAACICMQRHLSTSSLFAAACRACNPSNALAVEMVCTSRLGESQLLEIFLMFRFNNATTCGGLFYRTNAKFVGTLLKISPGLTNLCSLHEIHVAWMIVDPELKKNGKGWKKLLFLECQIMKINIILIYEITITLNLEIYKFNRAMARWRKDRAIAAAFRKLLICC